MKQSIQNLLHLNCLIKSRPEVLPGTMSNSERDMFYRIVAIHNDSTHVIIETNYGWIANEKDQENKKHHCITLPMRCWTVRIERILEIKGCFSKDWHDIYWAPQ